jgi:hypothetical protein
MLQDRSTVINIIVIRLRYTYPGFRGSGQWWIDELQRPLPIGWRQMIGRVQGSGPYSTRFSWYSPDKRAPARGEAIGYGQLSTVACFDWNLTKIRPKNSKCIFYNWSSKMHMIQLSTLKGGNIYVFWQNIWILDYLLINFTIYLIFYKTYRLWKMLQQTKQVESAL